MLFVPVGALGADCSARRRIEFCQMRQRSGTGRLAVCQWWSNAAPQKLQDVYAVDVCLLYDSPSGALRSHANSYHAVSFSLSLLHFIELCDASFTIDVWQASSCVRHLIGIEERDKDRVT